MMSMIGCVAGRTEVIIFNLILFPMEFQLTNIIMLREEDGMAKLLSIDARRTVSGPCTEANPATAVGL